MKVLMIGWELPPLYAGGIGMVCYEIIKELSRRRIPVTYLMPMGPEEFSSPFANLIIAENHRKARKIIPKIMGVPAFFQAYQSPEEYEQAYERYILEKKACKGTKSELYGKNLFLEVDLFAKRVFEMAEDLDFDVIHAHDWMTFPAAIGLADKTGKPLIVHVHNTIYDRYLGNASQHERDIELAGIRRADRIIALSNYVKNGLVKNYGIDPGKIRVVNNANTTYFQDIGEAPPLSFEGQKVVVYTGRVTLQKGPEYFIYAAKKVLEYMDDVLFVMAGTGEQLPRVVSLAAQLGISKHIMFTGRQYSMIEAKQLYKRADCYVMPSVSEPFGIVALEAMNYSTPTIVSKQSGCAEFISHALKVDFWNIDELANMIISVLSYQTLSSHMSEKGREEVMNITWEASVQKCIDVYNEVLAMKGAKGG